MNGNNNNNNDSTAMKQNEKWMSVWNNNEIKWNVSEGIEQSFSCCVTWLRTRIKFKNTFKQEVYINYSWKWMWKRLDNEPKCLIATVLSSLVFCPMFVCASLCECVYANTPSVVKWGDNCEQKQRSSHAHRGPVHLSSTRFPCKRAQRLRANMNE